MYDLLLTVLKEHHSVVGKKIVPVPFAFCEPRVPLLSAHG